MEICKYFYNIITVMFSKRKIIIAILGIIAVAIFFVIVRTGRDFVATKDALKTFGESPQAQMEFVPLTDWGDRDTSKREVQNQDYVLASGTRYFEDTEFLQKGNIILSGDAKIVFLNSMLEMSPAERGDNSKIILSGEAEIRFEDSTLKPSLHDASLLLVELSDNSKFSFIRSQGVNSISAKDNAQVMLEDSIWAFFTTKFRGGIIKVADSADISAINSIIGSFELVLNEDSSAFIKNFKPGKFSKLDLGKQFAVSGAQFKVLLEDSEILGDYIEGAGDRGLSLSAPAGIKSLRLANSEINKLKILSKGETLSLSGIKIGEELNFRYKNINIEDSKIMAEWEFYADDSMLHISDSSGIFLEALGASDIKLDGVELSGFRTNGFTGKAELMGNSIWKDYARIVSSSFSLLGDFSAQGLDALDISSLIWKGSLAEREFFVDILSISPSPEFVSSAKVELLGADQKVISESYTNKSGRANFSIKFTDNNIRSKFYIRVGKDGKEKTHPVDFFTPTPIKLILK